jgi:hypothetical protein
VTFWDSEPSPPETDSYAEMAGLVYSDTQHAQRDPGASLEATGPSGEGGDKWIK